MKMKKLISMFMAMVMMLTMFGTTGIVASADYKSEMAQLEKNIQSWKNDIAWYEAHRESTSQYESIYMGEIVSNNPLIVKTWNKYIHITNPAVAKPDITILGFFGFVESLGYISEYTVNGNTVWAYRAVTPQTYGTEIAELEEKIADAEHQLTVLWRNNERPYYMGIADNPYGVNSFDAIETLNVRVNDRRQLEVVVEKDNGYGYHNDSLFTEKFKWSSNKPSVVKVSSDGVITALKNGKAVITAKGVDSGRKVKCTVKVTTPAEDIKLKKDKINLSCGRTYKIKYTLSPKEANEPVYYYSSDETVATVSEKGKITAKNPGTAYIAAMTESGVYKTMKVTVLKKNAPKVTYEYQAVKLAKKFHEERVEPETICHYFTEKTKTGYLVHVCDFETNIKGYIDYILGEESKIIRKYHTTYTYDKSEKKIIEKDINGTVFTGDFIAATEIEISDDKFYDVTRNGDPYRYDIQPGEKVNFTLEIKDGFLDNKAKWTSSDNKVAKVDKNGVVTGISRGATTITCTMEGGATASAVVYVGTISIYEQSGCEMKISEQVPLMVKDSRPKGCWTTSDPSVVKVSPNDQETTDNAILTAVGKGEAVITFTYPYNYLFGSESRSFTVTVK